MTRVPFLGLKIASQEDLRLVRQAVPAAALYCSRLYAIARSDVFSFSEALRTHSA